MKVGGRFVTATLLWAAGMSVVLVVVDAMSGELSTLGVLRGLASALSLATCPAGADHA